MMRPILQKLHDVLQASVFDFRNAARYSSKREFLKDSIARETYLTSTTVWPILEENSTFYATQTQIRGAESDKRDSTDEKHLSRGRCCHTQLKMGAQRCIQSRYAEQHVSQYGEVHNQESCLIATMADRETQRGLPREVASLFNDAECVTGVLQPSEAIDVVSATLLDIWRQFLSTFETERALKNAS